MVTALVIVHVFICVLLVVLVLLQFGKGAEVGAVMGSGASQAIFSSSQSGNFLTKATTVMAILFMVNSVILTTLKSKESTKSVFDNVNVAPIAAPLNSDNEMNAATTSAAITATPTARVTATPAK